MASTVPSYDSKESMRDAALGPQLIDFYNTLF